ncbi:MAG: hypothetical protein P8X93_06080 [Gammaproteobacteria bacterium]
MTKIAGGEELLRELIVVNIRVGSTCRDVQGQVIIDQIIEITRNKIVAFDYLKDIGQQKAYSAPDSLQNINDEYQLSAGLRYFLKNGFSSNLQFNVNKEREEIDFSSLTFLLRLDL